MLFQVSVKITRGFEHCYTLYLGCSGRRHYNMHLQTIAGVRVRVDIGFKGTDNNIIEQNGSQNSNNQSHGVSYGRSAKHGKK